MRVNQLKSLAANEPRHLPRRPQVEAASHRRLVQGGRCGLAHRRESARLQTNLAHLEPKSGQIAGQQVLHAFRPGVMFAVDDVQDTNRLHSAMDGNVRWRFQRQRIGEDGGRHGLRIGQDACQARWRIGGVRCEIERNRLRFRELRRTLARRTPPSSGGKTLVSASAAAVYDAKTHPTYCRRPTL